VLLSPVGVPVQSLVSTLACILSIFQELDITGGDIKEVNQLDTISESKRPSLLAASHF
jgi:hypothetical protein